MVRLLVHWFMTPEYLCELVSIRKSSRKLRSSSQILLQVPVSRSSHMVMLRLVLQPPLCVIDCRQILEMRRLLNIFICSNNTPVQVCFHG